MGCWNICFAAFFALFCHGFLCLFGKNSVGRCHGVTFQGRGGAAREEKISEDRRKDTLGFNSHHFYFFFNLSFFTQASQNVLIYNMVPSIHCCR